MNGSLPSMIIVILRLIVLHILCSTSSYNNGWVSDIYHYLLWYKISYSHNGYMSDDNVLLTSTTTEDITTVTL